MTQVYRASYDGLVTGVTVFSVVLLAGMAVAFLWGAVLSALPGWTRAIFFGVVLLCAGILAVGYVYRTNAYALSEGNVVVLRPVSDVVIPIDDIRAVRTDPAPFQGSIRVAGNGGLFGFWGRFRSRAGSFTAYATRRDRGVVLTTSDRTIVLTPDEPEQFVAEIRQRLASGASG